MNYTTEHLIEALTRTLSTYGMNVVGAILTLIAGFALSGWLARLVTRSMRRVTSIDPVFHPLPGRAVRVLVLGINTVGIVLRNHFDKKR